MQFSIWDVAERARVSKSTVSRVLNGGAVSEATRQKVMEAIQEMGYRPNYNARSLRGNKSTVVGVLSTGGTMLRDKSICARFSGVSDVLQQKGYDLLLVHDDYDNFNGIRTPKYMTYLSENRIDGLITLGGTDRLEEEIKNASTLFRNVVYTGERIQPDRGFRVYLGNYHYSYDLFLLLLEHGHRRILAICRDQNNTLLRHRERAFRDACRTLGITEEGLYQLYNPYLREKGPAAPGQALEDLLRCYCQGGYTALFLDESVDTRQVLAAFAQAGMVPPRDYSIVTIEGGTKEDRHGLEMLTAAYLPDYEYGRQIAGLMIDVIENETLSCKDIHMSYTLVQGRSVQNLRESG